MAHTASPARAIAAGRGDPPVVLPRVVGGTIVAVTIMVISVYAATGSAALRCRLAPPTSATLSFGLAAAGLLFLDPVRQLFEPRAALTPDYDEGEPGRFGNQLRGIPAPFARPFGMGPTHSRLLSDPEPHDPDIGAFADGSRLAAAVFILLACATTFIAFRLPLRPSPFAKHAQIVRPALLMFFPQAFQIDIGKCRHVYMMLGMVRALEVACLPWQKSCAARTGHSGMGTSGTARTR